MKRFLPILTALVCAVAFATSFNVTTPITITGTTCTQTGNAFACNGTIPIPQCPSPPGAGPCTPPDPPPFGGTCPGFGKTLLMVENWANPVRLYTQDYGGFNSNDILVVQFTTGNGQSQTGNLPRLAGAEWQSGAADRVWALSATPCSFTPLPYFAASGTSSAVTVPFTVINPNNFGYYPILQGNTTYYLNIKNAAGSGCTSTCNMFMDLVKNGTP